MLTPDEIYAIPSLFSDEERTFQQSVRSLVHDRFQGQITEWFDSGAPPVREIAAAMGEAGLFGIHLDGYGCPGRSAMMYGLACHEVEACDSGLRSLMSVQGSLAMYAIWKFGSDEHKEHYLPGMAAGEVIGCFALTEPEVGSNPSEMRTTATRDGDDWILDGSKHWITNGSVADVAIVWARAEQGVCGFIVPLNTPGVSVTDIDHKMSLRASVTSSLHFDSVRLPADSQLPEARGLRAPLSCLDQARFGIVFGTMGAARDCLDTAIGYVTTRTQFQRPLAGFQITQTKLVDMADKYGNGMLLAAQLGRQFEQPGSPSVLISVGKRHNAAAALDVARTARAMLGANGVSLDYRVIRHMNNLESVVTYEGTEEIHTLVIGQALTGQAAFS